MRQQVESWRAHLARRVHELYYQSLRGLGFVSSVRVVQISGKINF